MIADLPLPEALVAKMAATPQNPRYHREGSVLAHTLYVLESFQTRCDAFALDEEERQVLYWASVLHDIGKTVTTVFENGRHRSPGHERAGLPMAQDILMQRTDIAPATRRRILDLVRWHGLPLRMMQQQQGVDPIKRLGTRTDLRLLGIFARCDFWGRDCDDKEEMTLLMEQFQTELAPKAEYELGKFSQLLDLYDAWTLRQRNAAWNAFKMQDTQLMERLVHAAQSRSGELETRGQRVTLVIGPPFAGKSKWIEQHFPDHFRVSLHEHEFSNVMRGDEYLIARKLIEFKHLMRVYLNRHRHVVLESRFLDDSIRLRLAEMLKDMPVQLDYVILEASLQTLEARNLLQASPMGTDSLQQEYAEMELYHPWEAHGFTYVQVN